MARCPKCGSWLSKQPAGSENGIVTLEEMESRLVAAALRQTEGNVKAAAALLGIDHTTVYAKIRKYDIPRC